MTPAEQLQALLDRYQDDPRKTEKDLTKLYRATIRRVVDGIDDLTGLRADLTAKYADDPAALADIRQTILLTVELIEDVLHEKLAAGGAA